LHALQVAQLAVIQQGLYPLHVRVQSQIHHDAELLAFLSRYRKEAFRIQLTCSKWLFHHQMKATLQYLLAYLPMRRMWGSDDDSVDFAGIEHGINIIEKAHAVRKFSRRRASAANGRQASTVDLARSKIISMDFAYIAQSNQSKTNHDESGFSCSFTALSAASMAPLT
jgi:hypothetical protein